MHGVFALRWTPADSAAERSARAIAEHLKCAATWTTLIDRRGVLLMHVEEGEWPRLVLPDEMGAVFGPLFRRVEGGSEAVETVTEAMADAMIESGGRVLAEAYWGGYAAVLHDRGRDLLHIVRDPAGGGAIHFAERGAVKMLFTRLGDFIAIEENPEFDEGMLCAFLVQPRLVTSRCAIAGVREILAGERVTLSRDETQVEPLWRPVKRPAFSSRDFAEAAEGLRGAVLESARAWLGAPFVRGRPVAHRLSGGLDSSIVLCALKTAGAGEIVCFNEYPSGAPEGDERENARAAAARFGVPLREIEAHPEHVDYRRLSSIEPGARPSHAELSFADPTLRAAIEESGARAVFSGQGGDQVFHRARTPFIAADALRDGVSLRTLGAIAFDTARLARVPVWTVAGAMMLHGVLRKPVSPYNDIFAQGSFAAREAAAIAREEWARHPWAADMRRTGPARAMRMAHVADLQYYHQRSAITSALLSAPVLASQPVVEFCLSAPPWLMTWGGTDRSLARAAFAADLPEAIARRTHKGDTTRYHARVLARQLDVLRGWLIDGELAARGLIDREAVRAALRTDALAAGPARSALLTAFLAELWMRRFRELVGAAKEKRNARCGKPSQSDAASP